MMMMMMMMMTQTDSDLLSQFIITELLISVSAHTILKPVGLGHNNEILLILIWFGNTVTVSQVK